MNITKIVVKATKTVRNPYEDGSMIGSEITLEAEPPEGRTWNGHSAALATSSLQADADRAVDSDLKERLKAIAEKLTRES